MLNESIKIRLDHMSLLDDPSEPKWPENCEGSRNALVIFIGPSPGGTKESKRREIKLRKNNPLWGKAYLDPLNWSRGFKVSFKPIVETIFQLKYDESAKLIARFNMDWMQNPNSNDVSYRYMWEGCSHILPILHECDPELVIPMDEKTFGVLQIALFNYGYKIFPVKIGSVKVKISDKKGKKRYHRNIRAFKAEKGNFSLLVLKMLQHPARIYDVEYAKRIGHAIRLVVDQISNNKIVSVNI